MSDGRRALLVGVQASLDATLPQRPGTLAAMRHLASRLGAGGWDVRLLLDDEPVDERRPFLANVLEGLSWITQVEEPLLVISGAVRGGAFLPRDARASIARTTLPLEEIAAALPERAAAILDIVSVPEPFARLSWAVGASSDVVFGTLGPSRFLRAVVRAAAGQTGDAEMGLTVSTFADLLAEEVPSRGVPAERPWVVGDLEVEILPPASGSSRACDACGTAISEASAAFCPSCGAALHAEMALDGGRYQILRRLGKGGMGEVFLAEDARLKVQRAIKLLALPSGLAPEASEELQARMVQEARAAQSLADHTHHVVRVFDVGYSPERRAPFLVMEMLEGETLSQRLERNRMTAQAAIDLALTIGRTLQVAHGQNIVHRDLKPDNVMLVDRLGEEGFVKLLDFGLVKMDQAEVNTATGQMMGTLQYMPPEQLKGHKVDARADVYSLGAVLYECLSGRRANPGNTQQAVFGVLLDTGVRPLAEICPGLPLPLCELVDRCLALDRERRPVDAGAFVGELEQLEVASLPSGYAHTVAFTPSPTPSADEALASPVSSGSLVVGEVSLQTQVPLRPERGRWWAAAAFGVVGLLLYGVGGPVLGLWSGSPEDASGGGAPPMRDAASPSPNPTAALLPAVAAEPPRARAAHLPAGDLPERPATTRAEEADAFVYRGGTVADRMAAWARDASGTTPEVWADTPPAVRRWLAEGASLEGALETPDGALRIRRAAPRVVRNHRVRGVGRWLLDGERDPAFSREGCGGALPGDRVVTARWRTPGYGSGRCQGVACARKLARALQERSRQGEKLEVTLGVSRSRGHAPIEIHCSVRP